MPKKMKHEIAVRMPGQKVIGRLLTNLFGPASEEAGHIIAEELRRWRFRQQNAEKVAEKKMDELGRRGVDEDSLRWLNEGDAFRASEAFSMEDDDTVQELWAGLLASAMDPDSGTTVSKAFVDLLKSIGPAEAAFLEMQFAFEKMGRTKPQKGLVKIAEAKWRRHPEEMRDTAIQNLMRLRCVVAVAPFRFDQNRLVARLPRDDPRAPILADAEGTAGAIMELHRLVHRTSGIDLPVDTMAELEAYYSLPELAFQLTSLGRALMKACTEADGPSVDAQA